MLEAGAYEERASVLDNARPSASESQSPRFRLLTVDELHQLPKLEWVVRSVLPAAGCAAINGPSGSGKSFLQIDAMAAIAEGREWFGNKVPKPRRIVVVVLEGEAGFRNRIVAWEIANGRTFPAGVRFVFQSFRLNERADVLALAAAIELGGGTDVLLIDTLNRAAPGADENSSRDMSVILGHSKELQSLFGGLLVLVTHTGKDQSKGIRGHSSLHAAMDAVIEVRRNDDRREWSLAKSKDDVDGRTHEFRLETVELGEDEDGELETSCVIRQLIDAPARKQPKKQPASGNQKIIWDAVRPLFKESRVYGMGGAPPIRPCLKYAEVVDQVKGRLVGVEAHRRRERTREALTGLVGRGLLGHNEEWLWIIE